MSEIKFDIQAFIQELKNQAMCEFILSTIEKDTDKVYIAKSLDVFGKYGVNPLTAIKIMTDLAAIPPKQEDNSDG